MGLIMLSRAQQGGGGVVGFRGCVLHDVFAFLLEGASSVHTIKKSGHWNRRTHGSGMRPSAGMGYRDGME
jgi:hypothetical protein